MFFFPWKNKEQKELNKHYDYDDFLYGKLKLPRKLPNDPNKLIHYLKETYKNSDDFQSRTFQIPSGQSVLVCYFDGLVDRAAIQEKIIIPFQKRTETNRKEKVLGIDEVIYALKFTEANSWKMLFQECLKGRIVIHVAGLAPVLVDLGHKEKRSLEDPTTELEVYGPKIGFIEHLQTNVSLLRQCLPDPRLKMKTLTIGGVSHTDIAVMYIEEYADMELVEDVIKKIKSIDIDHFITSRILAQQLVSRPRSVFPLVEKTERPDKAAYALCQGKVAILIDNMTFCNLVPTTLFSFYEISDDNNEGGNWHLLFLKWLRLICLIVSTIFPALYVALVSFHPELIPTILAMTLAESRNSIPFLASVEAFMMMFALDVLIEASMRLPKVIGQTVGIVGGLVIGQSAVEAGIVSSVMVIVIAFTAVASFTVPSYELASSWRIIRYALLFISSNYGLFGLSIGICIVSIHLASLESFGKPYLSPLAPFNFKELIDMFLRKSLFDNKLRGKNREG